MTPDVKAQLTKTIADAPPEKLKAAKKHVTQEMEVISSKASKLSADSTTAPPLACPAPQSGSSTQNLMQRLDVITDILFILVNKYRRATRTHRRIKRLLDRSA